MKKLGQKVLSLVLALAMVVTLLPLSAIAAAGESDSSKSTDGSSDKYKIVHLDCGRKYFSVDSIKAIIDNAAAGGFNYVELAVGNDGLRFLLDDMSLTVNGTNYTNKQVSDGIHAGNEAYYNFSTDELTESEMNTIIKYANDKGIGIIPLINTPGHMDAILSCIKSLGIQNAAYNGSVRTIDITGANSQAVAFTKALLQKYITYFASKGCKVFNMGADEYANDVYQNGGMGFGKLQTDVKYGKFVTYVNDVASMIEAEGMTPMAFNDGIYYNGDNYNKESYKFDTNIMISYWSSGWGGYTVASAQYLANKGFEMINTNGDYYWVLGKTESQCDKTKAKEFKINEFQSGTIDNPAGAMFCIWCDYPGVETDVVSATKDTITAFGETLPKTETTEPTEPVEPSQPGDGNEDKGDSSGEDSSTKNETITIAVGETKSITIEGTDYSNDVNKGELDKSIADVDVKYEIVDGKTEYNKVTSISSGTAYLISDGNGNYLTLSNGTLTNSKDPSTAIKWTISSSGNGYRISYKSGNNTYYLRYNNGLTTTTKESDATTWSYNSNSGFSYSVTSGIWIWATTTTYYLRMNNGKWEATTTKSNYGVPYTITTTDPVNQTTITFTGNAVGTTYVTVGNTRYTINVQEKAPTGAMTGDTLTVEYWITNNQVYTSKDTNSASSVTINKSNASSEEGIAITSKIPATAYSNYDGWIDLNFWQAMREDKDNHQTNAAGDDETADGTAFTYVRYKNGAWQYKTSDGKWHYFQSGDQAVAYYMRHTEITQEITTAMKDWGYGTDKTTPGNNDGQVALTVAVVYPDGTVSPAEGDMYSKSTTIFNYWSGRDIGIVAPLNNSDYDISKITVTDGNRTKNTTSNTWGPTDSITWNKATNAAGTQWYNESEIWNDTMGTEPMVNGKTSNITWSKKNTAKLVLIYLKPVHHESNLTVKWVDDSDNSALISSQEVVVGYEGSEEITFKNGLKQDGYEGQVGTIILDDNAYITNSSGVNQTFNKDITIIPGVAGKYTSGLYEYTTADISEDGKTLTLHYTMKSEDLNRQYIVDYGLPMTINLSDLVDNTNGVKNVVVSSNATYNSSTKQITYTPSAILSNIEVVTARVEYNSGAPVTFKIGFVPATSVYYEESFIKFADGWSEDGTSLGGTQAVNTKPYGTDAAYSNNTSYSNGKAKKVEIAQGEAKQTAEFTFTGTGFDFYSKTGPKNGLIKVEVKKGSESVKTVSVQSTGVNDLYQIPVASIENLEHGTYNVVITAYAAYNNTSYPALGRGGEHIIDAVQVYDTIDTSKNSDVLKLYKDDNEAYAKRLEVRDKIITSQEFNDKDSGEGAVYIEMEGSKGTVEDYTIVGPKNEVYFNSTKSLVGFTLETSKKAKSIQIGAKSVNDDSVTLKAVVNNQSQTFVIGTNTAQNYVLDLTNATPKVDANGKYQYTIYLSKSAGTGILSVTDVKSTFDEEATAEFKYNSDIASGYQEAQDKNVIINNVDIIGRVRYAREMTMQVVTSNEIKASDKFEVIVDGKKYTPSISKTEENTDGTFTYTLKMTPKAYKLFGNTVFNVYLLNGTGAEISSGTASTRIYLL